MQTGENSLSSTPRRAANSKHSVTQIKSNPIQRTIKKQTKPTIVAGFSNTTSKFNGNNLDRSCYCFPPLRLAISAAAFFSATNQQTNKPLPPGKPRHCTKKRGKGLKKISARRRTTRAGAEMQIRGGRDRDLVTMVLQRAVRKGSKMRDRGK